MEVTIKLNDMDEALEIFAYLNERRSGKQAPSEQQQRKPGKAEKPAEAKQNPETPPREEPDKDTGTIPFEEVHKACAALIQSGKTAKVRAVLEQFGVKKVSQLEGQDYAAILEALHA